MAFKPRQSDMSEARGWRGDLQIKLLGPSKGLGSKAPKQVRLSGRARASVSLGAASGLQEAEIPTKDVPSLSLTHLSSQG